MTEDRRQILDMLAEKKITTEEADRLIAALGSDAGSGEPGTGLGRRPNPKYLRVLVDTIDPKEGPTKVNIRVPVQLLRAGVKLTGLIPAQARDHMNEAMREQGINFDVNRLNPDNLDDLIDQLNDLTIDVDQANNNTKVRVFCE
jgi:SHOCT-like domain